MAAMKNWPRAWRLTLYWAAMMITVLILVPAFVVVGAYLLGFGACDKLGTAAASQICSPLGRLSLGAVLVAGVFILFLPWTRFLQRAMDVGNKVQPSQRASSSLPGTAVGKAVSLPFGQQLLSSRVESCSRSGRYILLGGITLTFWSLYPFQKGWLKEGDQVAVAYQRLPLSKSKLALAFWNGFPNPVRGVAAITQSLSILIAAACIVILTKVPTPLPGLWIKVCTTVVILSSLYLILMLRAKTALRRFIAERAP